MIDEIKEAAKFLSGLLSLHSRELTKHQLELFHSTIITLLSTYYQKHWFPEKPFKGSGYRCLRINHKMDPMIARAGRECGLNDNALRSLFPNELTLWIDPREVSYRIGENGSICVIYDAINEHISPSMMMSSSPLSSSNRSYSSISTSPLSSASSSPSNWSSIGFDDSSSTTFYSGMLLA
jgi:protein Tob/BTG